MRDPFAWTFPIGRFFGITVRVHLLFPLVCLGLVLRYAYLDKANTGWWIDAAVIMGLLFLLVLLHEFGHCFAARYVNGEANEVLLWPLGGLARVDVPHTPWANFVTAAGGPLVNVGVCILCALALAFAFDVSLQPFWNPFHPLPVRDSADGAMKLYAWNGTEHPTNNLAALLLVRFFYVSWITLLLNVVLVGFPLDGGRMLQCALWPYVGYRQATMYAVNTGFAVMFLVLVVAIIWNEVLLLFLGFYIYTACKQEWLQLETGGEESLFGYDFSQGYTSLEKDEPSPAPPRRKKQNFIQRWLQRRAARKLQKEQEREQAEAKRVDELLDKIQKFGKDSLTDEEQRFLKRYADKMRNK